MPRTPEQNREYQRRYRERQKALRAGAPLKFYTPKELSDSLAAEAETPKHDLPAKAVIKQKAEPPAQEREFARPVGKIRSNFKYLPGDDIIGKMTQKARDAILNRLPKTPGRHE